MEKQGVVLVVDDDPDMLSFIDAVLTDHNYKVISTHSGHEALTKVVTIMPDLILLDITMPYLSGYEVCAKLQEREETAYIPVIFVTALGEEQNKAKALAMGAVDYVVKPVEEKKLLEKLQNHLRTSRRWRKLKEEIILPSNFARFKEHLANQLSLSSDKREKLAKTKALEIYSLAADLGLSNNQIAKTIANFLKWPYLLHLKPEDVRLGILPTPFCRSNHVIAINDASAENVFVLSNPFNNDLMMFLKNLTKGSPCKFLITEPENIMPIIKYSVSSGTTRVNLPEDDVAISDIEMELRKKYQAIDDKTTELSEKYNETSEPIIVLTNKLIENAYEQRASDIHIEPWESEVVVRYRIDGNLQMAHRLRPQSLIRPIVSRIKIMSRLDIAERRMPQDGRIVFKEFGSKRFDFDLRVAISPMNFGEKVVLRILDKQKSLLPLQDMGFSKRNLDLYRSQIRTPYGMILHVGPTGSGKSMTLYSALNEIASPHINIQTIEDPVEYTLRGINQLQVNQDIDLTFARALRCFMRQDPNVILVGEIRDVETAHIAIQASLTGHLLFSTLHTNDSASTITRFLEMEIEPFMLSSCLIMVCAQRLLRRLCNHCKAPWQPDEESRHLMGYLPASDLKIYRPKGCPLCNGSGYKGRIGIHEILVPDDQMRSAISKKGVVAEQLKKMAVKQLNMTTLWWDAIEKVRYGICALEDLLAKVKPDEFDTQPNWLNQLADAVDSASAFPTSQAQASAETVILREQRSLVTMQKELMAKGIPPTPESSKVVEQDQQTTGHVTMVDQENTMKLSPTQQSAMLITGNDSQLLATPGQATILVETPATSLPTGTMPSVAAVPQIDPVTVATANNPPAAKTEAAVPTGVMGVVGTNKILVANNLQNKLDALKQAYAQHLPAKLSQIEELWHKLCDKWDSEEIETLHRLVHSLVGSGATYGFKTLSDTARELETLLKDLLSATPQATPEQQVHVTTNLQQLTKVCQEVQPKG